MPRDLLIGNGTVLANFDYTYNMRDFYFPHIGMENHTAGHQVRFGVWADGIMKWITDGWQIDRKYLPDTLVTDVRCFHPQLKLELHCRDCVDFHIWLLLRQITVFDKAGRDRDVRLFFSHDFHIDENIIGDTAYYDPRTSAIVHYKKNRYFLINVCTDVKCGVDQWACGIKEFKGLKGTWVDAEDGILSGSPIAQGAVYSTVGLNLNVPANGSVKGTYWICCQHDYDGAVRINRVVREKTPEQLIRRTENYWRLWSNRREWGDLKELPRSVSTLFKRSLLIIRTQIDSDGGIIAGTDYDLTSFAQDTYSYIWPRDGALTAYALARAGYAHLCANFFNFCLDVITPDGYLLHKYNPDKTAASSWHPWLLDGKQSLPIQEDSTALVIWSLWQYFCKFRDVETIKPLYRRLITNAAEFMLRFRNPDTGLPNPSYDLWEERYGVHLFTVGAVLGGLIAAANFADAFGETEDSKRYLEGVESIRAAVVKYMWCEKGNYFGRMVFPKPGGQYEFDDTVDAANYGIWAFGGFDPADPKVEATMNAIKTRLWVKTDVGGIARYTNDLYFQVSTDTAAVPGNPWIICTLWLAQYNIARAKTIADLESTLDILDWACKRALPSGVLAEQIHPFTGRPLSVSPLTWSHATFVMTVMEYLAKHRKLSASNDSVIP
jgi:GH15 family glucan-1,4-alpha-glucosidase